MNAMQLLRLFSVAWVLVFAGRLWAADSESPAILLDKAQSAPLVAVTQVGQGFVAVGDHGVVVVSDNGQVWHQAKSVAVDGLHGLIVHGFILLLVIAEDLVLAPAAHGNATAFAVMERAAEVRAFLTGVCESSAGEHHAKCTRIGASWDACPSRMRLVGVAVVLRGQSYRPAHHVGNELLPVVHRLQVGPKVFNSQPVGVAMLQISVVMPIPIGSSETAYLTV